MGERMMKKTRFRHRKLTLQALDRRCVMDAEGLDVPVEVIMADGADEVATPEIVQVTADEMSIEILDSVMLRDNHYVTVDGVHEMSVQDLDSVEVVSLNSVANSPQVRNFDVNGDGRVTPLDALLIINSISRQRRDTGAAEFARASIASDIENGSPLDVNRDTHVTPLDALMVINEMSRAWSTGLLATARMAIAPSDASAAADDPSSTPVVIPEEAPIESVKSLVIADIGTYRVVSLEIDSEGAIKADADGQVIEIAVGKDGGIMIGELVLPAYVVSSVTGEPGLVSGYPPFSGDILHDYLLPVDIGIGIWLPQLDYEDILDADPNAAKSLTLADVGTYGIVTLTIDADGMVSAAADGETKVVVVAEDGTMTMSDMTLPAILFTSSSGATGLFYGFAPKIDLFPGDEPGFAIGESTRVAGASVLTVTGIGDLPLVVSVSSSGDITALAGGETLEVIVGEDGVLSIGDQRLPISILKFDDTTLLVPMASESRDVVVSWPMAVDEVMAEFA